MLQQALIDSMHGNVDKALAGTDAMHAMDASSALMDEGGEENM